MLDVRPCGTGSACQCGALWVDKGLGMPYNKPGLYGRLNPVCEGQDEVAPQDMPLLMDDGELSKRTGDKEFERGEKISQKRP